MNKNYYLNKKGIPPVYSTTQTKQHIPNPIVFQQNLYYSHQTSTLLKWNYILIKKGAYPTPMKVLYWSNEDTVLIKRNSHTLNKKVHTSPIKKIPPVLCGIGHIFDTNLPPHPSASRWFAPAAVRTVLAQEAIIMCVYVCICMTLYM